MKRITTSAVSILFCFMGLVSYGQELLEGGGEYPIQKNDANTPCLTAQQYQEMIDQTRENCKKLGLPFGMQGKVMSTSFNWPLRMANGLNDCSYYCIFNYVDQDATAGIKDYNCGTATYDGHRGDDIATFPYPFFKMDNNQVEVIAAASGTIVNKVDGNFDKNCAANNLNPNYIIVQHADGSCALYLHMKMNSLTVKTIGQTVTTGEFLGVVGSSGSSTSPHLHFEVWAGNNVNTLNESYSGPCNGFNMSTWWANQKPYTEPSIIKAQVNKIAPVLPNCPGTETPNDDSCFISPGNARFYIFIRNETNGYIANMRIVNPNGSTFSSWTHNSNANYFATYWYMIKPLPTIAGTYTFEAVYNGDTCTQKFKINCVPSGLPQQDANLGISVSADALNNTFNISGNGISNGNYKISLLNVLGQDLLLEETIVENNELKKSISTSGLVSGIYFLVIEAGEMKIVKKICK